MLAAATGLGATDTGVPETSADRLGTGAIGAATGVAAGTATGLAAPATAAPPTNAAAELGAAETVALATGVTPLGVTGATGFVVAGDACGFGEGLGLSGMLAGPGSGDDVLLGNGKELADGACEGAATATATGVAADGNPGRA